MSDQATPQSESDAPQAASTSPPPAEKKPRSPLERTLVWGGIIVLLLLVAFQAHARLGYEFTVSRLRPLINDEDGDALALADVDSYVLGFPSRSDRTISEARGEREYRWQGLAGSYGFTLSYNPDIEPVVVSGLVPFGAPEPEEPPIVVADGDSEEEDPAEGGPRGGPGGGGMGTGLMHVAGGSGAGAPGGGGRFNPMENDADGDGLLSPEEAPERMRENFDEIDADQSGFIDETEIEAMRERFRQQFSGGGGRDQDGGDRPQRPQRPAAEDEDEAAADASPEGAGDEEATPEEADPDAGPEREEAADSP